MYRRTFTGDHPGAAREVAIMCTDRVVLCRKFWDMIVGKKDFA